MRHDYIVNVKERLWMVQTTTKQYDYYSGDLLIKDVTRVKSSS